MMGIGSPAMAVVIIVDVELLDLEEFKFEVL